MNAPQTPPALETGVRTLLPPEWLHVDREITCREGGKAHEKTVAEIALALKAGAEIEPVTVAMLNGRWTLIDGLHRYEAFMRARDPDSETGDGIAVVSIGTLKDVHEARWRAGQMNWTGKRNLTGREKREVFRRYVNACQHRKGGKPRGPLKGYPEIAKELPGVSKSTLHNWMRADFPSVASAMGRDADKASDAGGHRNWKAEALASTAARHRDALLSLAGDAAGTKAAIEAAEAVIWKLTGEAPRRMPVQAPGYGYDFS
ncbi:hypothetical protein FLX56_12345 [Synechococcus moorigangaii CMS01]|nr:hypothetical protein [Synechococcus moorigangaii CMS01]